MGRARARAVGLSLGLLVLTGCFGGGSSQSAPTTTTGAGNGPGCQFIVASESKRETVPIINQAVALVDAAARPTVCYDQIAFTFLPGNDGDLPPAYTVQYLPLNSPILANTSTTSVTGVRAVLEVVLHPASATDIRNPSNPTQTYKGNLRLTLTTMSHALIVEFLNKLPQPSPDPNQSQLVWLIGLDAKRPFTTDAANSPPRVLVDIMN